MLIFHKGYTNTIHVYSVTVMTLVKALQAGQSSQGTSEPITPAGFPRKDPPFFGNPQIRPPGLATIVLIVTCMHYLCLNMTFKCACIFEGVL